MREALPLRSRALPGKGSRTTTIQTIEEHLRGGCIAPCIVVEDAETHAKAGCFDESGHPEELADAGQGVLQRLCQFQKDWQRLTPDSHQRAKQRPKGRVKQGKFQIVPQEIGKSGSSIGDLLVANKKTVTG